MLKLQTYYSGLKKKKRETKKRKLWNTAHVSVYKACILFITLTALLRIFLCFVFCFGSLSLQHVLVKVSSEVSGVRLIFLTWIVILNSMITFTGTHSFCGFMHYYVSPEICCLTSHLIYEPKKMLCTVCTWYCILSNLKWHCTIL